MSRFNDYAVRLDETAKAAFEDFRRSEKALKAAEEKLKKYPQGKGVTDPKYIAAAARAKADYVEAEAAHKKAKAELADRERDIAGIRKELSTAIDDAFSADPARLDTNTLELLKSGILSGNEYKKLLDEAKAATNSTMIRLIGKYAENEAAAITEKFGQGDIAAKEFRAIAHQSRTYTGKEHLQAFDDMAEVFHRCTRNPAMIDRWETLTADIIARF